MIMPDITVIRARRKELGLTQKELAKEAGVSQSLLAKIESGRIEASYAKVKRIFEVFDKVSRKEGKKASDVMTKEIIKIRPNNTVNEAIAIMKKHSISQIPIFSGNRQVGSISESTIIAEMEKDRDINNLFVKDIMEEPLPTVSKDVTVNSLLPLLKETSAVLVIDKSKIVGIVTKADVI